MSENRANTRLLIGLVAMGVICLVGLSVWVISNPTAAPVERDQVSSEAGTSPANRPSSLAASDRPASDDPADNVRDSSDPTAIAATPVSLPFAQYDQKPEGYVGTDACAECHSDRHQSYLLTHHSRSLREVDLTKELAGGSEQQTLAHPLSKVSYDVFAKDGRLWHRQWRHFSDAPRDRLPIGELPVCYVMGSGAFGQGYLLGDGDYLIQSPVTWYAGTDDLGMAPGYDRVDHVGLTRVIAAECMFCHAGLLSQRESNPYHLAIHELSIGCERCHGPGEAHSNLYREIESGTVAATPDIDPQIVNPARLDRRRSESICGQCHLHGDIVVHPPGREIWDFVAGDDLAETRLHYKHDKPGDFKDSFTGHFDQMWQSECYLQSETLTCLSCHDPHRTEPIADLVSHRRQQCNKCHSGDDHCGLPLAERVEQADNSCTKCHMPTIETDVPHTSTTSHLIAVYEAGKPRGIEPAEDAAIRRLQRSPQISDSLLNRADSLAGAMWAFEQAREAEFKWLESVELDEGLNQILLENPDDAATHSLLARMNRLRADWLQRDASPADRTRADALWAKVKQNATQALQLDNVSVTSRERALESLSNQQMQAGDFEAAARSLTELAQLRRSAVDWYNLGLCFGKLRRLPEAERALREAIRLDGAYAAPYRSLSILYRNIDPAAAQQLAAIAQRLAQ